MAGAGHQTGLRIPGSGLHGAWAQGLWVCRRDHRGSCQAGTPCQGEDHGPYTGCAGDSPRALQAAVARTRLGACQWQLPVWGVHPEGGKISPSPNLTKADPDLDALS